MLKTKVNNIERNIPDVTTLIHINGYNTDKQNLRDISTSGLVTITVLNTKISEGENKIPDNSKHITTQKFNESAAENFAARLKKANLVSKTDFDNKLTAFNK